MITPAIHSVLAIVYMITPAKPRMCQYDYLQLYVNVWYIQYD